jgi:hypothetical protein
MEYPKKQKYNDEKEYFQGPMCIPFVQNTPTTSRQTLDPLIQVSKSFPFENLP